jgi:uncharacterized protein DUF4383
MNARNLALIFGIVFLGLGVLGMMPGMVVRGALLGVFPTNLALALLHVALGAWGLAAFMVWSRARTYARGAAFIFAALGLMGMVHGLDTLFGLMPLHGNNVWLHLVSAGVAGFVAWKPETGERRGLSGDRRRASRAPMSTERRQSLYDRRRSQYLPQA